MPRCSLAMLREVAWRVVHRKVRLMVTPIFDVRLLSNDGRGGTFAGRCLHDEGLKGAGSRRFYRMVARSLQVSCAILFAMLMSSVWGYSADVVFIRSAAGSPTEQQELEVAARFYGLNLKVITASAAHNDDLELSRAVERNETLAVAMAANALAQVNEKVLLQALPRRPGGSVPLLILGVTPETDPTLLQAWSGGAAVGCARLESPLGLRYAVGRVAGLTGQLSGFEFPFPSKETFYFALDGHKAALEITKVRDDHQAVPVFIEAALNQQRVFLECTMPHASEGMAEANEESLLNAFAKIAPAMIIMKYCAGEQGWHALHHFANLTIDDPWLREPYGFLDYKGLLVEMEKHDFHTTIALIPWNYDRSSPEVVSLIRSHPERFSICIHGNNHDHKEFTDYSSKPLGVQIAALQQSLARMDRFQALTGIPYDKVMVFPHSIPPEKTIEALKAYSYLATINSANVPMDSPSPPGLLFALRPVTLSFGGFPSIIRYSVAVAIPDYFIAINEFLDDPLFFYCHHELFQRGMGAFNDVAAAVGFRPGGGHFHLGRRGQSAVAQARITRSDLQRASGLASRALNRNQDRRRKPSSAFVAMFTPW